jgi:hypothetical protein
MLSYPVEKGRRGGGDECKPLDYGTGPDPQRSVRPRPHHRRRVLRRGGPHHHAGRGLPSSTSSLNVSTLCVIRRVTSVDGWVITLQKLDTTRLPDQNGSD